MVTQAVTVLLAPAVRPLRRKGRAHPVGPVRAGGRGCLSLGSLGQQDPRWACAELAPVREVLSLTLLRPLVPHPHPPSITMDGQIPLFVPSFFSVGPARFFPAGPRADGGSRKAVDASHRLHRLCLRVQAPRPAEKGPALLPLDPGGPMGTGRMRLRR